MPYVQWAHGFDIKFGLYAWEPGMGSRREIRAATPLLAGIYKELPAQVVTLIFPPAPQSFWPQKWCPVLCIIRASNNSHETHRLSERAMAGGTCP